MTIKFIWMAVMSAVLFGGPDASAQLPGDGRLNPVQVGGGIGDFNSSGRTGQPDLDFPLIFWGKDRAERHVDWVNDFPAHTIDHFEVNRVLLNWDNESDRPLEALPRSEVEQIEIDAEYLDDVLPGYIVNDLSISFEGQYTGSQLRLELTHGTIYQEPLLGRNVAPVTPAAIQVVPELEFDTFVANGGLTLTQSKVYGVGLGAINLRGEIEPSFDESKLNVMWYPAGGMAIVDQLDFLVARVTMSPDAMGYYSYVAFSNGLPTYVRGSVHLGMMERAIPFPEPTSLALSLLLVACATFCAKSRTVCFAGSRRSQKGLLKTCRRLR